MPWSDYRCPYCTNVQINVVFAMAKGAVASAPICPSCRDDGMLVIMEVIPAIGRMDAGNGSTFQAFEVAREVVDRNPATGQIERFQRKELIDSVHKARAIERDSERRAANGEGEPMRFRMLSQNPSNKDAGSFGSFTPGPKLEKSGRVSVTRHGEDAPTAEVAPGVPEGGGSTI